MLDPLDGGEMSVYMGATVGEMVVDTESAVIGIEARDLFIADTVVLSGMPATLLTGPNWEGMIERDLLLLLLETMAQGGWLNKLFLLAILGGTVDFFVVWLRFTLAAESVAMTGVFIIAGNGVKEDVEKGDGDDNDFVDMALLVVKFVAVPTEE